MPDYHSSPNDALDGPDAAEIERILGFDQQELDERLTAALSEPAIPIPPEVLESGELLTFLRSKLHK